jgi:hypothetical protein
MVLYILSLFSSVRPLRLLNFLRSRIIPNALNLAISVPHILENALCVFEKN